MIKMTKRTRAAIVCVSFMLALYQTTTAETNFSSEPSDNNNERNKRPLINPGFPIRIDGQQYIVPYSTGGQYLQLCEEKAFTQLLNALKHMRKKSGAFVRTRNGIYKVPTFAKENVALKQQNTILRRRKYRECQIKEPHPIES